MTPLTLQGAWMPSLGSSLCFRLLKLREFICILHIKGHMKARPRTTQIVAQNCPLTGNLSSMKNAMSLEDTKAINDTERPAHFGEEWMNEWGRGQTRGAATAWQSRDPRANPSQAHYKSGDRMAVPFQLNRLVLWRGRSRGAEQC